MKWFYITAVAIAALMALSPMLFIQKPAENPYQEMEKQLGRPVVVNYDSYSAAVKSLDPATCGDTTSSGIQGNIYEGLYSYHYLIRPPEVVPQLAAAMPEISADRLTYTIKLRPGVLYHRNPCFGKDPADPQRWGTRTVQPKDFIFAMKRIADYHGKADLAWTFLSEHVAGIDAFRERTQGLPPEIRDDFAVLDGWARRTGPAKPDKDVLDALARIGEHVADLHVPGEVKSQFEELATWARQGKEGPVDPAVLATILTALRPWRDTMKGFDAGDWSRYDMPVEGLKAVDDLTTLQIKLVEPFPQFIYVLAMHVYAPIPREAVEYWFGTEGEGKGGRVAVPADRERSTEFSEAEQIVGTGPYLLKTFQRKQKILLVRNSEFRHETYPSVPDKGSLTEAQWESVQADIEAGLYEDAGKVVPFIDVVDLDFVEEDYSAWMRFLSKQSDAAGIPKETFEFVITPDKDLTEQWRQRHIYLKKYSSPAIYWLVFNMEDPVVGKSKALRRALNLAFDRANYIKVLLNERGRQADNIIPSSFKGNKEAGVGPYARMDAAAATEQIALAKKELAAAGVLVNGEIPELKLDVGDSGPATVRMTDFIKQQFAKVGVKLKVNFNDWPTQQRKVRNKQAQIYTMGWHADYPDAENFLQLFYSPNIAKYTNNANYSDAEFDRLYVQARTMEDTPERTALYARMARIIGEDCPVLLLDEHMAFVLYYDWVGNIKQHPIGYGFSKYRRIDAGRRRELGGR